MSGILSERGTPVIAMIKRNKEMIWDLAVNDFSTKYAGSAFGIFWAFVQPVITILMYWCVFEFGLKSTPPVQDVSYIFWFATGMVPWFFFSDALNAVTNCLIEYGYLVKKVVFDIELLPVIKILSALFIHLVFIGLLFLIAFANGEPLTASVVQVLYYLFCATVLVYAFGKFTSAIILFFRDLGQIVNIVLQIGLWATPIIWSYVIVPPKYQWVVKLNPVFYVIEGYRDSFITNQWFFEQPLLTAYFWGFALSMLWIGNTVFKRMRPHFADVL